MKFWRVVYNQPGLWYPEFLDFSSPTAALAAVERLRTEGMEEVTIHELRHSE